MKFTKHTIPLVLVSLILTVPTLSMRTSADVPAEMEAGLFDLFKKDETSETEPLPEDIPPKRGDHSPDKPHHEKKPPKCGQKQDKSSETGEECVATSAEVSNWYCKHMENGKRPPMPGEMTFIDKHGGYFLGEDDKVIYLTFDAGYENGNIARILDTLKAEEVPAAFFVLENLVTRNTDLVKRMADEGHTVCNHTASHADMTTKNEAEFTAELAAMEKIYKETIGTEIAKYYRPPEGKFTEANLDWANSLGYKTIFWSYAYADWDNDKQMPVEKAMKKVLDGTHNGEVLLLHPTSSTNADILPGLIKEWKAMGYRFGTLDELTDNRDLTRSQT